MSHSTLNIAIIGAGITGLTLAKSLTSADSQGKIKVDIFEKARGVGGRTSTRRAEPFHFDHGAPFFTAKSADFNEFLNPLSQAGVLTDWQAKVMEVSGTQIEKRYQWQKNSHFVGMEKMNAIAKYLASQLPNNVQIQLGVKVVHIEKMKSAAQEMKWALTSDAAINKTTKDNENKVEDKQIQANADLGCYDWVICTAPSQQAAQLVPNWLSCHAKIADHHMQGCYALMLGFDDSISQNMRVDFDVALIKNSILSCITVNSAKPNRPDTGYCFTVLSNNQWADTHIDADQNWVHLQLLQAVSDTIGYDLVNHYQPTHIGMHRWRFANTNPNLPTNSFAEFIQHPFLLDIKHQFAVAGDWLFKSSLENAFISGHSLGNHLRNIIM